MQRYLFAFLIFTSAPSAFATELPKEGSYDYTACWSGVNNVITFSKALTASRSAFPWFESYQAASASL